MFSRLVEYYNIFISHFSQDVLQWRTSRKFFYWRLRRRQLEEEVKSKILAANPDMMDGQVLSMIGRWFVEAQGPVNVSRSILLYTLPFHFWGNLLAFNKFEIFCLDTTFLPKVARLNFPEPSHSWTSDRWVPTL